MVLAIVPNLVAETLLAPKPVASSITVDSLGTYETTKLDEILTKEREAFSGYPVVFPEAKYAVRLFRVTYRSVIPEHSNRPTVASGLIAIPVGAPGPLPVVSYQHGTVFLKTEVPSHPNESPETRLMIAQFAGQGYLLIAADYFGKGLSPEPDSYFVKQSTQQACLDMLFAARSVCSTMDLRWGPLFLSGWSQGGWSTMVFLNKLETLGIPVRAAATVSAPEDLFALVNRWLHAPEDTDAVFIPGLLALQIHAYEEYYALPGLAHSAIRPAFRETASELYTNDISWAEAAKKLPKRAAEFLDETFAANSSLAEGRFWEILQQNQAYRWRTRTPLRSYYGSADEVIPPYIATLPVEYQRTIGGAPTSAVEVPGGNHRGAFVQALFEQKKWFDTLLKP